MQEDYRHAPRFQTKHSLLLSCVFRLPSMHGSHLVRQQCLFLQSCNIFVLVSTSVALYYICPSQVLWPYLLECIVPEQYTDAMATVCRAIGHIAGRKREEKAEDYEVDFQRLSTAFPTCSNVQSYSGSL